MFQSPIVVIVLINEYLLCVSGVEYVYVYGGRNADNLVLTDEFLLDTNTWAWTKVLS